MNERIYDLAGQAKFMAEEELNRKISYNAELRAFSEKFAELIVKECIDIAQDRANFPGYPPNDVNDIIDEIREHFGVEE